MNERVARRLTARPIYHARWGRVREALPKTTEAQVIGKQLLRSGTSVGGQVREGNRSRSDAEMISKTEGALQELEETMYWLELLADAGILKAERLADLLNEADELTAILVTGVKTLKSRRNKYSIIHRSSFIIRTAALIRSATSRICPSSAYRDLGQKKPLRPSFLLLGTTCT